MNPFLFESHANSERVSLSTTKYRIAILYSKMNAASDESGPPPQLVVTGMEQQFDEANGYLEKHKIPWVLEQITQSLVYERPSTFDMVTFIGER